jgi:hypothetical protein
MFIIPHGAPEGYEWFVTIVVLVGLYFAVRNFMRARRWGGFQTRPGATNTDRQVTHPWRNV